MSRAPSSWEKTHELCAKLHLEHEVLADDYILSLQWVDLTLGIAAEPPPTVDGAVIAQSTAGNGLRPI